MSTVETAPKIVRELPPNFQLARGSHDSPDKGMCFREAARWIAGETHSDNVPDCMCDVLATIGMRLNDLYTDEERQLLLPLMVRAVGTRSTREVARRRSLSFVDASIREIAPMVLNAIWPDLATQLREIAPIVDTASARAAQKVTAAVRSEAWERRADAAYAAAAAYAYAAAAAAYAYAAADDAAADADDAAADAAGDAADADAAAADAAYAAADAAAYAYAYAAADDAKTLEERSRLRAAARRPVVLATIAAFSRAIDITA